jgi:hypothetical protein
MCCSTGTLCECFHHVAPTSFLVTDKGIRNFSFHFTHTTENKSVVRLPFSFSCFSFAFFSLFFFFYFSSIVPFFYSRHNYYTQPPFPFTHPCTHLCTPFIRTCYKIAQLKYNPNRHLPDSLPLWLTLKKPATFL